MAVNAKGPSCKVCGDEASGFHYGVDSCEGCKGFFRRCLTQGMTHRCTNSGKCEITAYSRNNCQSCRLHKCFEVGMSREASRLGRRPKKLKEAASSQQFHYTTTGRFTPYGPRSDPTLEKVEASGPPAALFQGLSRQQLAELSMAELEGLLQTIMNNLRAHPQDADVLPGHPISPPSSKSDSGFPSPRHSPSAVSPCGSAMSPDQTWRTQSLPTSPVSPRPPSQESGLPGHIDMQQASPLVAGHTEALPGQTIPHHRDSQDSGIVVGNSPSHEENEAVREEVGARPSKMLSEQCIAYVEVLRCAMPEVTGRPSPQRLALIGEIIKTVADAHMTTCNYTLEKTRVMYKQFMELAAVNPQQAFCHDPVRVWQDFVAEMVPVITRVVKFCKRLPGFGELPQPDQIRLIKQGSFGNVLIRYTPLFEEDGLFVPSMEVKVPWDVIIQIPTGEFFQEQHQVARVIRRLKLTDTEVALLGAVIVVNPAREGLANQRGVIKLQELFLQTLYLHLKVTRPDSFEMVFQSVLDMLPVVQQLNEEHVRMLNSVKMSPTEGWAPLPALHIEVYSNKGVRT